MKKLSAVLLVVAALAQAGCSRPPAAGPPAPSPNDARADHQTIDRNLIAAYGKLPLSFEANKGQSDPRVDFQARGPGYAVFLTPTAAVLVVSARDAGSAKDGRAAVVSLQLIGSNASPAVSSIDPLPGTINYFRGNQRIKWTTGIPQFARVRYHAIYPGVDVVYYGQAGRLEHDFIVAPGADPGVITLRFEGAENVEIDDAGDLVLRIADGQMRLPKPRIYQPDGSMVGGGYVRKGARDIGFDVSSYDRSEPLIIDPVLEYSTNLGAGTLDDFFNRSAIAVDAAGSAYIVGQALAFPTTPGSYQPISRGDDEAVVVKLAPDGSQMIYATFIGGSSYDIGTGIAVDAFGRAYVTGQSFSADFPTTPGAPAGGNSQGRAFAAKLSSDGSALIYSTGLGSSENDRGNAIAVDSSGNAYVTGERLTGGAFLTKLNSSGTAIVYSNLIGGNRGRGIAVDDGGRVYVTGDASGLQASPGAFQTSPGGGGDAFVMKFDPIGSSSYTTYLGGSGSDYGADIAIDADGNAYVTGATSSTNFPVTAGAFQTSLQGLYSSAAFVTKVNPTGSALLYSTLLAAFDPIVNTSLTRGSGIAVDGSHNIYVTGTGAVPPVNSFQSVPSGASDAFVAKLNPDLSGTAGLVFATILGGAGTDQGHDIAVDPSGNAYVSGRTRSTNFFTVDPLQTTLGGGFVAKIAPTAVFADLGLTMTAAPDPVTLGDDLTYTVTVTNAGPNNATHVAVIDEAYGEVVSFSASQGSCTRDSQTSNRPITCEVGALEAGHDATVTIVARPSSYTPFTNKATVRSNVSEPNPADNSAVMNTVPVGPPLASFSYACSDFTCSFDASGSSDNGTISSYAWDFGDGATGAGLAPNHTYTAEGTYSVTLTVTDEDGLTGTRIETLAVPVANPNAPYADFSFTCNGSTCSFDASYSWDPDDEIVSYGWDFGDGTTGSDVSVSHTFAPGVYNVTLTVTDGWGLTGTLTQTVEAGGNAAPTATFTFTCTSLTCSFNGSASSDPDGTIASYSWSFGDGTSGSGSLVSHTYAGYGSRIATLTVADNAGAMGEQSQVVNLTNTPPMATFTASCVWLVCNFDGNGSSDPDGTIVSYSWSLGDGQSASGSAVSHAYSVKGVYVVRLTVTDNGGATQTFSASQNVVSPTVHAFDLDGVASGQQNTWTATVTITVHDGAHASLANATVSGSWSNGSPSPTSSCITGTNGRCTLSAANIPKKIGNVTFTVTNVIQGTSTYTPEANHDPEADSNGTTIRVVR